jgi:hypothetical protein
MTAGHEETVRIAMAGAVLAVGVASFLSPQCMFGVPGMMACSKGSLSPSQRERLSHALAARRNAEGIFGRGYGRLFTVLCVAAAGMEFVPGVPYVLPYAIICIGLALITYLGYIQFRRAADRRVAPLERRSVLAALPLISIVSMLGALAAALMFTIYPPLRLGALAVAAATLLLGVTAWRIATAPSLLLGEDPQVEYAIDQRLRVGRATGIAVLACAPGGVFAAFAGATLPGSDLYATVAQDLALAALIVALIAGVLPLIKRLSFA